PRDTPRLQCLVATPGRGVERAAPARAGARPRRRRASGATADQPRTGLVRLTTAGPLADNARFSTSETGGADSVRSRSRTQEGSRVTHAELAAPPHHYSGNDHRPSDSTAGRQQALRDEGGSDEHPQPH